MKYGLTPRFFRDVIIGDVTYEVCNFLSEGLLFYIWCVRALVTTKKGYGWNKNLGKRGILNSNLRKGMI